MMQSLSSTIEVWSIFLPACADRKKTGSRQILRDILSTHLNCDPASIRFEHNENGKPFLPGTDIEFNLSHSRERLLVAVTQGRPVGIDIEFRRSGVNMSAIADRWFSPEEKQFFQCSENAEQAFFDIWTKKEAFVKAQGLGIFHGLSEFTVPLESTVGIPNIGIRDANGVKSNEWLFQTLEIEDAAYASALVSKSPAVPVVLKTL